MINAQSSVENSPTHPWLITFRTTENLFGPLNEPLGPLNEPLVPFTNPDV
jgi:hypothetical protein